MRFAVVPLVAVIMACTTATHANKPAPPSPPETHNKPAPQIPPEQLLCKEVYFILVGRVSQAAAMRKDKLIGLSIRVHRMLGAAEWTSGWTHRPASDDTVEAMQLARAAPFHGRSYGPTDRFGSMLFDAPLDAVLSPHVITSAYTGADFIFSLSRGEWDPNPWGSTAVYRYNTRIWPLDREQWVEKTMASAKAAGHECPTVNSR